MKLCRGCGRTLPLTEFTRNSRSPDGLEWRCRECSRELARRYYLSEQGRAKKREWHDKHRAQMNDRRRQRRLRTRDNPLRVRARLLIGNAVRRGYIEPPDKHHWTNRWEFHHVDYSRPYYGVWVRKSEHDAIDHGLADCPPCADYTEIVKTRLLSDWGLS